MIHAIPTTASAASPKHSPSPSPELIDTLDLVHSIRQLQRKTNSKDARLWIFSRHALRLARAELLQLVGQSESVTEALGDLHLGRRNPTTAMHSNFWLTSSKSKRHRAGRHL